MTSRRALQAVLLVLSLIPLVFGTMGLVTGAAELNDGGAVTASLDSQFRFMSAWYVGLAALIWWIIPRIEREATVFRIVCGAIFLGGIARLVSVPAHGWPQPPMIAGLALELVVPALIVWQARVGGQTRVAG